METTIINIQDIIFREDLYPRFNPNQAMIQRYATAIEYLPPIKINQNNILIDGFHRWKAHQLEERKEIKVEIVETSSEKELKRLAYQLNSNHGLQLTNEEKRKYAQEMIGNMSIKELSMILSVDERSINRWTETQREVIKEERNRRIIEMYLSAWNTQESIAEVMGVDRTTITKLIDDVKKRQMSEIHKNFQPYIYNIWNLAKKETETEYFGVFPQVFMENLLYYHTNLMDIIYDPFSGNGTIVDACKKMFRRYYCSDLNVTPGREKDIKQWDITQGLPGDLPKPEMVFLDPPYWLLAKEKYSEDTNDLGNVNKNTFYKIMTDLFNELYKKKINKIAYVIRPIWITEKEEWQWIDPTFNFYDMISKWYQIETRYQLPYSSQQYSALWVDRAKKQSKCLITTRDLIIMKKRGL